MAAHKQADMQAVVIATHIVQLYTTPAICHVIKLLGRCHTESSRLREPLRKATGTHTEWAAGEAGDMVLHATVC